MNDRKPGFFGTKKNVRLAVGILLEILIGATVYHFAEGWDWIDAIYFSVITLTTVGYGDLSPQTDFGKIFTIIYLLTGVGLVFSFINEYFQYRFNRSN
tara:strand:- start:635 stop:928 length:294 start_codon:yes stop_codon:yes gene_type:complete